MVWIRGVGWVPDSEGDSMADGSDDQGWDIEEDDKKESEEVNEVE